MDLLRNFKLFVAMVLGVFIILRQFAKNLGPYLLSKTMTVIHANVRIKEKLFAEAFERVESCSPNASMNILEVGIGTGCNFKFFPKNSKLTILDKSDQFLAYLEKSIEKENRTDLSISKLVVNKGEDMCSIESGSMDAVVHTFIMCSVEDHNLVLNEIYRVLKPGGVCVFIEHALDETTLWRRCLQKTVEASGLTDGCKFKKMKKLLQASPYDTLVLKDYTFLSGLLVCLNPLVYGYGLKKKE